MSVSYRINYRIVEGSKFISGTRIIDVTLDLYMDVIRKNYPDASVVYLEFVEEIEEDDTLTVTSGSIVILPYAYDSLLP